MNCISGSLLLICLISCTACNAPASETESQPDQYSVHYRVVPEPDKGTVFVEMTVDQSRGQLRELSFDLADDITFDVQADNGLTLTESSATWRPGTRGGKLTWRSHVSHRRGGGGYDALLDERWGIFRAEDIIPRARTVALRGSNSATTIEYELPADWSVVSEYPLRNGRSNIAIPSRRFDQPQGWMALGKLGVRRESIGSTRIAVAAPEGESVRRMDMLALMNWILPELNTILPNSIPTLTIVSAGDPMWRGGLSAPGSIFIHADRPLISENATSTLAHEVFHVAFGASAESGDDWIIEGLAEYYSLELLLRGGAITASRYQRALEEQTEWARDAQQLCSPRSSGAETALAVVSFRALDKEIQRKSGGKASLDSVVAKLADSQSRVSLAMLRRDVSEIIGGSADALKSERLPGCPEIAAPTGT